MFESNRRLLKRLSTGPALPEGSSLGEVGTTSDYFYKVGYNQAIFSVFVLMY